MQYVVVFLQLLLVALPAVKGASDSSTATKCCSLGLRFANDGSGDTSPQVCSAFSSSERLCQYSAEVCCRMKSRSQQCNRGTQAALSNKTCIVTSETYSGCCEVCKLGLMIGSLGEPCQSFQFGEPWDSTFVKCCESSNNSNNVAQTGITDRVNQIALPGNKSMCDLLPGELCSHICVPTEGSYICKCEQGFVLLSDGKTCAQRSSTDRCATNNPCSHICRDTGLSIECSCPPGYELNSDRKTCLDVDECEEGTDNCNRNTHICQNREGNYTCLKRPQGRNSCPAGYQLDLSQGNGCKDVDECAVEGLHHCQPETEVCRNTVGAYACDDRCDEGYKFNSKTGTCDDVDECEEEQNVCASAERCYNSPGSYLCVPQPRGVCPGGYRPGSSGVAGLCDDIDECREGTHTCQSTESCVNEMGGFRCVPWDSQSQSTRRCPQGYTYSAATRSCVDEDECATEKHSCSPSERCVNQEGTFQCEPACQSGFRISPTGSGCQDIDECAEGTHACPSATHRCVNKAGGFDCVQSAPSSSSCQAGYRLQLATGHCKDIDECTERPGLCINEGKLCVNTPGSFLCQPAKSRPSSTPLALSAPSQTQASSAPCPAGFRFNAVTGSCTDIDECNDNVHVCNSYTETCQNLVGAYQCVPRGEVSSTPNTSNSQQPNTRCAIGFMYSYRSQKCVDLDECRDSPCDSNQICENTEGSFLCKCKEGYKEDSKTGACIDINECQTLYHECVEGQHCVNTFGSYQCIRHANCGTGYTLNAATGECEDNDECAMGIDNCAASGPGWSCRNTQGSFRCHRKQCGKMEILLKSGVCESCPPGHFVKNNICVDVDECASSPCTRTQRCVNTVGSFNCYSIIRCHSGYRLNNAGDACVDIDECSEGTHNCKPGQSCFNRMGSFQCRCPDGHVLDPAGFCVDIDECNHQTHARQVCPDVATCENTPGSYRCICKEGFKTHGNMSCTDINECEEMSHLCMHNCNNLFGSYRCSCRRGFALQSDNRTCGDIDECKLFQRSNRLCVGQCVNTQGSYICRCPPGYKLGTDNRACIDIDECLTECRNGDQVCVNMAGSFRCNAIRCPDGYERDLNQKKKRDIFCPRGDTECLRKPQVYSYSYLSFLANNTLPPTGPTNIFTLRGHAHPNSHTISKFQLVKGGWAGIGIEPATEDYFQIDAWSNSATISLLKPLPGPQDIHLEVSMEVYRDNYLLGSTIAHLFIYVSEHEF